MLDGMSRDRYEPTCRPGRRRARIRPLARGEEAVLQHVFDGLSPQSRYLRYHTAMPRLPATYRRALTEVDGRRHVALVAEWPGPSGWVAVGLGRLVALGEARAELALEVVDAAQRQGVGRTLLTRLVALADRLGYCWIEAAVLSSNAGILRLLGDLFPDASRSLEDATIQVRISLDCPAALDSPARSSRN
jgi:GNAT superfamily N-acetyltransferase